MSLGSCECAFVSIKGSDYRWFKEALERGDLPLVKATAAQLPAVNLEDALSVVLLDKPSQHRLPRFRLMSERRERNRRLEQAGQRRVLRLKRPTSERPHRCALGVVRLVFDYKT
jgi:hypothetical protein